MISHGIESPGWMAKQIILHSPVIYLRKAVIDLITELEDSDECQSPYEIIDRLTQVAATGQYIPSEKEYPIHTVGDLPGEGELSPEDEDLLRKFQESMDDWPDGEDPFDSDD